MLNTGRKETNGSVPVCISRSYLWITNLYILVACLLNNVLTLYVYGHILHFYLLGDKGFASCIKCYVTKNRITCLIYKKSDM